MDLLFALVFVAFVAATALAAWGCERLARRGGRR